MSLLLATDAVEARAKISARSSTDEATGCWIWTAGKTGKGYGSLWWYGREWRAHRLAYQAFVGPIPEGQVVHHVCKRRDCVNPAHLDVMDHAVHTSHHRGGKEEPITQCKRGHAFDEVNTRIRPDGKRSCRACQREWNREMRRRAA